ncbi:hypothetical protein Sps_01036 [Shewanella psychrophila]|uniref:Toxin VasX N-terminal region domain-containing protein n=1 Tax=Shewanella psychrophila TaxID=225848 RepID=A0A1S6HL18_9GAMM|nr:T6SS effector BTH_I2691 family protein [Shewanella psychrophila]AQS36225.1 hypothetical protein Sps_01036 [Shewanella psychrophila]
MSDPNKAAKCAPAKESNSPVGLCPLRFNEIGIIPVRYAFDDVDEQGSAVHSLPDSAEWRGRFKPVNSQYTLRQLRDGWLYVYNQTAKTFHEYQVEGFEFIKIDWSDSEANKPASERGTPGERKSCLIYPKTDTIHLVFAHQRWTWRVCEHMRSNSQSRQTWMRKLDLKRYSSTMKAPHAQDARKLAESVADVSLQGEATDVFVQTCTPLVPDGESRSDDFKLVANKPDCSDLDYLADLPAQDSGVFIALDDPLADVSDLFLKLSVEVTERVAILGDEETIHKTQMAELARSLGRVRVEYDELPASLKEDPLQVLAFEKALTKYLALRHLADNAREGLDNNPDMSDNALFKDALTNVQERANQKLAELQAEYQFTPTQKQTDKWIANTAFSDEVSWSDLDAYLIEHYTQLKGKDERIAALYDDFMDAFTQLATDPLALGLDNQDEYDQAYLLTLISQFLIVVKQVPTTEAQIKDLDKALSLDSPNNLFALASLGFSMQNWQALNEHVDNISQSVLSTSSSGDMTALWSRLADWDGLTGDTRIQDKVWFKALVEPVQLSFLALQKAAMGQALHSWRATMDLLFPSQWAKTASVPSLFANLRLVILETMMTEEAITTRNPEYKSANKSFHNKLNVALKNVKDVTHINPGQVAAKKHLINTARDAQLNIQRLFTSELPPLIMLKNDAVNHAAKKMINEYLESLWRQTSATTMTASKAIGGFGGIVAVLNLWNASAILLDLKFKMEQEPGTDALINPALREAIYVSSYAVASVPAVFMGKVWDEIIKDKELLKQTLAITIKDGTSTEAQLAKTFAKHMVIVSSFGLIATVLETFESFDKLSDSSNSSMARAGYGLKFGATGAQVVVFGSQLSRTVLSRLGLGVIGKVLAPWMVSTFMVAGILYLISILIINVFTRSDLEKWLRQSSWGVDNQAWSHIDEVKRLERIIHRPQVSLKKVPSRVPSQWMDPGSFQWQVNITLPPFTQGRNLGLKIIRIPKKQTSYHSSYQSQAPSSAASGQSDHVIVNEQEGVWQRDDNNIPSYSLILGGSDTDHVVVAIKMPLNWLAPSADQHLFYLAKGVQPGALNVGTRDALNNDSNKESRKEISTRIITVGGKL